MQTRRLALLLLLLPSLAPAAENVITIPNQGWQISFEGPSVQKVDENDRPGQYMYAGNADRFNVSVYVEDPGCKGGDTHKAFYDCFWPRSSRNPMIVPASVVATEGPRYYKVAYDVEANEGGLPIRQRNTNFLIAYRGKWTDLHVSVIQPTAEDLAMLDSLEKSLAYGEAAKVSDAGDGDHPGVSYDYLDAKVPIDTRLDKLDSECTPLIRARGPSLNALYDAKMAQARDAKAAASAREDRMPELWGLCIGVGLKM